MIPSITPMIVLQRGIAGTKRIYFGKLRFAWQIRARYFSVKPDGLNSYDALQDYSLSSARNKQEESILICGDGDLSFGASLSKGLRETRPGVRLVASVLETQMQHNGVYKNSEKNIAMIRDNGHEVMFQVDATELFKKFGHESFDRIQFNFPHWKGRTNNRRNRKLISDFLSSSKEILSSHGQIHLGLYSHQGGMCATNHSEWRCSWKPACYGAENDLLLTHVLPFDPGYELSAYQWRDRPFVIHKRSEMYILTKSNLCEVSNSEASEPIVKVPKGIQMYSYFTLFISLPQCFHDSEKMRDSSMSVEQENALWSMQEALDEDFIQNVVSIHLPEGIRAESKMWRILREKTPDAMGDWQVVEYKVALFGEQRPITHQMAEMCKKRIEDEVQVMTKGTRRSGWPASHILPSYILYSREW